RLATTSSAWPGHSRPCSPVSTPPAAAAIRSRVSNRPTSAPAPRHPPRSTRRWTRTASATRCRRRSGAPTGPRTLTGWSATSRPMARTAATSGSTARAPTRAWTAPSSRKSGCATDSRTARAATTSSTASEPREVVSHHRLEPPHERQRGQLRPVHDRAALALEHRGRGQPIEQRVVDHDLEQREAKAELPVVGDQRRPGRQQGGRRRLAELLEQLAGQRLARRLAGIDGAAEQAVAARVRAVVGVFLLDVE